MKCSIFLNIYGWLQPSSQRFVQKVQKPPVDDKEWIILSRNLYEHLQPWHTGVHAHTEYVYSCVYLVFNWQPLCLWLPQTPWPSLWLPGCSVGCHASSHTPDSAWRRTWSSSQKHWGGSHDQTAPCRNQKPTEFFHYASDLLLNMGFMNTKVTRNRIKSVHPNLTSFCAPCLTMRSMKTDQRSVRFG